MKTYLVVIFFLLIIIAIYNYIEISKYKINKVTINSNRNSKDIKIVQISDFHSNKLVDKNKIVQDIETIDPHIVVLTGDLIDYKDKDYTYTLNFVESLVKINTNIFYVHGNHEMGNKKGYEFIEEVRKLGVKVLENENTEVEISGETINICGINFYINNYEYEKAIEGINEENYTILLAHSPDRPLPFLTGKEDLILSGHTHGGQVRLPIIGAILAPGQGSFPKYDKGIYKINDKTTLYIDSGLGNSVFPLRFFNRVQFSYITVKSI